MSFSFNSIRRAAARFEKSRPHVVGSPEELNAHMETFIVAPLTSGGHPYPIRVALRSGGKYGHVVLDQIRTVDDERLDKRLGALNAAAMTKVLGVLQAMSAAWAT